MQYWRKASDVARGCSRLAGEYDLGRGEVRSCQRGGAEGVLEVGDCRVPFLGGVKWMESGDVVELGREGGEV